MNSIFTKGLSSLVVGAIFISLTSCATLFAPRNQKITINKGQGVKIQVDGKTPKKKKGKYLVDRRQVGVQVSASKEGYKTENKVIGTYKNHPLKTFVTLPLSIPLFGYPYFLDKGLKSKNYPKELTIGKDLVLIPVKAKDDKEIQLNKVTANVKPEDIKSRYFGTFKRYYRREDKREAKGSETTEKIEVENTVFTDLFNDILKKSGFIDTSKRVLKNSFANNLLIDADIQGITFHQVRYNQMLYTDITIAWEVLDYYKNSIYTTTTTTTSGEFSCLERSVYGSNDEFKEVVKTTIQDAMEYGLYEFLSESEVQRLLKDKSTEEKEKSFTTITLPTSGKYVSSVGEAIKSGVTIKNNKSHGSGFIVSPEGHIITNYHVIAGNDDMKVVLNDGKKYDFTVVRESKIHDLVLLKINASGLKPMRISNSKNIEIGETVYAVGTPSSASLSQTVSKGIISGVRKNDNNAKQIQTDVSVNGGNSGGALINKQGVVVGVVSSKLLGIGVEGVGFGIPAYEIFDRLKLK